MIKLFVICVIIGASLANHLGPNRWAVIHTYNGLGCQGEPILINARVRRFKRPQRLAIIVQRK
jgi:hypothetical protein